MSKNVVVQGGGLSLYSALFLVFLVLKLTGHIAWSWWWVTSPLWIPLAVALPIILFCIVMAALVK